MIAEQIRAAFRGEVSWRRVAETTGLPIASVFNLAGVVSRHSAQDPWPACWRECGRPARTPRSILCEECRTAYRRARANYRAVI